MTTTTPETDTEELRLIKFGGMDEKRVMTAFDFARKLERKRDKAVTERQAIEKLFFDVQEQNEKLAQEIQRLNRFHVEDIRVTNESATFHMQHANELTQQLAAALKKQSELFSENCTLTLAIGVTKEALERCGTHDETCNAVRLKDDGECDCPMRAIEIKP